MGNLMITRRGSPSNSQGFYFITWEDASTLPSERAEKTIAIIGSQKIGMVYMCADRPESVEIGDVWVSLGKGATITVRGPQVVMPITLSSIYQYSEEGWNRTDAYIKLDGAWTQISIVGLLVYTRGENNENITGGWGSKKDSNGVIEWNSDSLLLGYSGSSARYSSVYTNSLIDVTSFSKLVVIASSVSGTNDGVVGLQESPYTGTSRATAIEKMTAYTLLTNGTTDETVFELDISELEGSYRLQFVAGISTFTIHEVYIE